MTGKTSSIERLEEWIEQTLREAGTPGAAVLLERHGEPLLARGFGHSNVDAGLTPDIDTVFGIGSVTKSFTALAILLLEEEGLLATSDPAVQHLPELRLPGGDAITIHQLLTHTSGLPPLPTRHFAWLSQNDLEAFEREEIERLLNRLPPHPPIGSLAEMVEFLAEYPYELHAGPGEQFSYSNEGYNLLGAIVERVSRTSLPAFVEEHILVPAGMTRTSMDLQFTLSLENVTQLYVRRGNEIVSSHNWFNPLCWSPAGGVRSTAADLARYFRMLASEGELDGVEIATPASIQKMTTAYARRGTTEYGYGLVPLANFHGHSFIRHGGGHKGVAACAGFAAGEGVVCTVLSNLAASPAERIWAGCVRAPLGLPLGPLFEQGASIVLPLETLRSFAGTYYSPEGGATKVLVDEAGVVWVKSGGATVQAEPTAEDTLSFVGPGGDQTIHFLRLRGDAISHAAIGLRLVARVAADHSPIVR